jgi:pimeloyl-ACP methyl ester carboxylesterase
MARKLVERLPHGTLDIWTGAGHFGPLEDPDRCIRALRANLLANDDSH